MSDQGLVATAIGSEVAHVEAKLEGGPEGARGGLEAAEHQRRSIRWAEIVVIIGILTNEGGPPYGEVGVGYGGYWSQPP